MSSLGKTYVCGQENCLPVQQIKFRVCSGPSTFCDVSSPRVAMWAPREVLIHTDESYLVVKVVNSTYLKSFQTGAIPHIAAGAVRPILVGRAERPTAQALFFSRNLRQSHAIQTVSPPPPHSTSPGRLPSRAHLKMKGEGTCEARKYIS